MLGAPPAGAGWVCERYQLGVHDFFISHQARARPRAERDRDFCQMVPAQHNAYACIFVLQRALPLFSLHDQWLFVRRIHVQRGEI